MQIGFQQSCSDSLTAIESSRLKRISLHSDHDRRFDLRKIVPAILEVNSTVSESGSRVSILRRGWSKRLLRWSAMSW